MIKRDFPKIHFYDQDFVDIYDKTWAWIQDCWNSGENGAIDGKFFSYPGSPVVKQFDAILSSFFLVYSNRIFQASPTLDLFYERQEPSGAIRRAYDVTTGLAAADDKNPEGLTLPLFPWAEFNLYHKSANKKRVKDILPVLHRYTEWIDSVCRQENGLYRVPLAATETGNAPREGTAYPVDFNACMAVNALYISALADILNDKEVSFQYKRRYFSLKTRINSLMWDSDDGFYYDIDENERRIRVKTLAGYWPLLAEIPNDEKAERIIEKLQDPRFFGTPHPFPSVAAEESVFLDSGGGYRGSVFPHLTFMVIKGLERYQRWDLARDCAIRHLYFILDSMNPDGNHHKSRLWEACEKGLPFRRAARNFPFPSTWPMTPFPRSA